MGTRTQRAQTARETIREGLLSGAIIDPEQLADQLDLIIPETDSRRLWLRTWAARLVHDEARSLGLIALSLGPGQGYRAVTTEEDMRLARARAEAQLRGQAVRGKRLREKLALLNQRTFDLEGVPADVAATDPAGEHQAESA